MPHVVTATFPRKVTPSALATVNRKLLTGLVGRPKRRVEDDEEDEDDNREGLDGLEGEEMEIDDDDDDDDDFGSGG